MSPQEKRIEDELSSPIIVAERVNSAVETAKSFKLECSEVKIQVNRLLQMLLIIVRFATATSTAAAATPLYEPPIRHIAADTAKNLDCAYTLVRKCNRFSIFRRIFNMVTAAKFRKLLGRLDASVDEMKWLIGILDADGRGRIALSIPPIASKNPNLSGVWSLIATIQMGKLNDRIKAANEIALLAKDNDRNKMIIVEESGVPPLLKLLKEAASPAAQIAAATALCHLAYDLKRVRVIVKELGVPIIVQVLGYSHLRVQTKAAILVARMTELDPVAHPDFARENVVRVLVMLLSFDMLVDDQINNEIENKSLGSRLSNRPLRNSYSNSYSHVEGTSPGWNHGKERELKLELKISCVEALWTLARGSVSNSKKITETKGMLCLAKLVEKEQGELQYNCLMTIMEITAAAESNSDFRHAAFRINSPPAKAVVEQLLRIIKEVDSPILQIPALRSIGSLARIFPARETRVISRLVAQLSNKNVDVAAEAAIALGKFCLPNNFLCVEHSKAIIEFRAVPALIRLLRANEVTLLHGLVLLCYLALHADNNMSLEQSRVLLTVLVGADRVVNAHPELRELVPLAIARLKLYHAGMNSHKCKSY